MKLEVRARNVNQKFFNAALLLIALLRYRRVEPSFLSVADASSGILEDAMDVMGHALSPSRARTSRRRSKTSSRRSRSIFWATAGLMSSSSTRLGGLRVVSRSSSTWFGVALRYSPAT